MFNNARFLAGPRLGVFQGQEKTMTNHPNRNLTALPVLDDNTTTATVMGWARTETGAIRVATKWFADHGNEGAVAVTKEGGVKIEFNRDINTDREVERANRAGSGWIVSFTES